MVKIAKIGVYGEKTRALQQRMSYERVAQTWKIANVFRYLGSRDNPDPNIKDVQVTTFMEVPDRAYDKESVPINIYFEPIPEQVVDYTQFGVIDPIGVDQIIRVHINSYEDLGRPIMTGDVIDVPFFKQKTHDAMWEVVDVDRGQEFEKFYSVVKLKELTDSRSTREIEKTGSIGPTLADIVGHHEEHADDQVGYNGVDDTNIDNGDDNQDMADDFDGRQKNQKSFLDDFDGGLV